MQKQESNSHLENHDLHKTFHVQKSDGLPRALLNRRIRDACFVFLLIISTQADHRD
jgi:hypothetical protein